METSLERIACALEKIADSLSHIDKTLTESKTIQSMRDSREATHPEDSNGNRNN